MKISAVVTILAGNSISEASRVIKPRSIDPDRRYDQLLNMISDYNPSFDQSKYFVYGCNCLFSGDQPLSRPGHGPPVDALDTVCKAYKDCLKCAKIEYGEICITEFVKYRYGYRNGEPICKSKYLTRSSEKIKPDIRPPSWVK